MNKSPREDITKQKQASKASEKNYKELVESTVDFFFTIDNDLRYTHWNKACEYFRGISAEDAIGKSVTEVFPEVKGTKIEQFYLDALRTKRSKCFVTTYRVKDKDCVFEINAYPTKVGLSVFVKDITERKRAEEELIRLSSAVKMSTDSIVITDLDGKIIDVNEVTLKMYGASDKKDLIGRSSFGLIAPEERENALADMKEVLEKGYIKSREYHVTTKEGTRIPVEMNVSIMSNVDGKPIGFVAISRDITERKKAEEALQESEQRFRGLSEATFEAIAIHDKGKILDVNQTFAKMFGYELSEVIGKNVVDFVAPESRDIVLKNILSGFEKPYESIALRKDGSTFADEICGKAMPYHGHMVRVVAIRDITEQKKAEERIRASEERYRNLVELAPDSILTLNLKGVITSCNKAFTVISGYSKDELIGENFSKLAGLRARDIPKYLEIFNSLVRGKVPAPLEVIWKDKNGMLHSSEVLSSLIKKENKIVGVQTILRDTTERKKAEESIRNIIDTSPDAIVWVDTAGKITLVNKKGFEITGFSKKDLIGRNIMDVEALTQKSKEKISESFMKRLKGIDTPPYEVELVTKNGEVIPAELSASTIFEEGKPVGTQSILRDLRERKAMEGKLRQYSEHLEELVLKRSTELLESEERCSILIEGGSDGVATVQDGKIVFINKRGQQIVGYSKDELIGLPFVELVGEQYRQFVEERYGRRLRGGPVQATYEIELIAKNGEHVPVELSVGLTSYQGRPADAIILRDIRDRKRLEEQHLRLERLAAIGELAAMVGHDLRNPLQSIKNATSCLKLELSSNLNDEDQELMKIIDDSIEYSNKIVRDLLDYSSEMRLERTKTTPEQILKRVLSLIRVPENVRVLDRVKDEPEIEVDVDKIVRVFINIIMNATESMPEGGILTITSRESSGSLEVAFADTGTGMTKEVLEELWTPLRTKRAKGIGLGLPICKRIVEAHRGSIRVKSTVGKGTTFAVALPTKLEAEDKKEISVNGAELRIKDVETQHPNVRVL
jgi:PAS domain S-box-containing protein